MEARGFRDRYDAFRAANAEVLGVSTGSLESHRRFAAKQQLSFPLIADTDHALAEAYGVWKPMVKLGPIAVTGVERSTFLIDEEGRIARIWRRVSARRHPEEVLTALRT